MDRVMQIRFLFVLYFVEFYRVTQLIQTCSFSLLSFISPAFKHSLPPSLTPSLPKFTVNYQLEIWIALELFTAALPIKQTRLATLNKQHTKKLKTNADILANIPQTIR